MTFDDGPDGVWTPRILDALAGVGAAATFFVVAPLAVRHPDLIGRMIREGHEVSLHCGRHVRHTEMSGEEVLADTRRALEDLARLGIEPSGWRPPWGVVTGATERAAQEFGLDLVLWNLDTHDWRGDGAEEMFASMEDELCGGSVILMHDGIGPGAKRSGCEETLALVPILEREMRGRGLTPTTVSGASWKVTSRAGTVLE